MKKHAQSGFSLIEMIVVIVIIGVLTGMIVVNLNAARERSRDARRKSEFNQIRTALVLYETANGDFPTSLPWGAALQDSTTTYMGRVPTDPLNQTPYVYTYAQHPTLGYIIAARLENDSDPESRNSQIRCGVLDADVQPGIFMVCNQ